MKVRSTWLIHYVYDMDRAKNFYMKIFQVKPTKESEGWTELDLGSMVLALHSLPAGNAGTMPHAGLSLNVDNLDEVQADVELHGGRLIEVRERHGHVPEQRCFEDSEGNGFECSDGR